MIPQSRLLPLLFREEKVTYVEPPLVHIPFTHFLSNSPHSNFRPSAPPTRRAEIPGLQCCCTLKRSSSYPTRHFGNTPFSLTHSFLAFTTPHFPDPPTLCPLSLLLFSLICSKCCISWGLDRPLSFSLCKILCILYLTHQHLTYQFCYIEDVASLLKSIQWLPISSEQTPSYMCSGSRLYVLRAALLYPGDAALISLTHRPPSPRTPSSFPRLPDGEAHPCLRALYLPLPGASPQTLAQLLPSLPSGFHSNIIFSVRSSPVNPICKFNHTRHPAPRPPLHVISSFALYFRS